MKKRVFETIMGIFALMLPALAGETGYIQIKCEPGVQIFLNHSLEGVTNTEQGGLIILDVDPGYHELEVVKSGFQPRVDIVTVVADQVVAFEVKPLIPKVKIIQEGEKQPIELTLKVGSLQIYSLPIECSLSIDGLGVNKQAKEKDQWRAEDVPVGTYSIVTESMGNTYCHRTFRFVYKLSSWMQAGWVFGLASETEHV